MSDASDPSEREYEDGHPRDSVAPVRERMQQFLAEHDTEGDSNREGRDGGKPLSEIVIEDRDERL